MTETRIALVTGANKGIGFAIARGLLERGWSVGVGARDDGRRAAAVEELRKDGGDAFAVPLDVTDDASVAAAAALLGERSGRLDALVNNAGIVGDWPDIPSMLSIDTVRRVLETNVIGVVRVTNAMLPLLRRSAHPRIVNQSSHVASLEMQSDPEVDLGGLGGVYAPSKTMLNALTVQYAAELAEAGVLVNAVAPGYVATDLNGFAGSATAAEGARPAIAAVLLPDDGPTGRVLSAEGTIPW